MNVNWAKPLGEGIQFLDSQELLQRGENKSSSGAASYEIAQY